MSVSICIPCHNYMAEPLLAALREDVFGKDIPIFLTDDGSEERYKLQNAQVATRYKVHYEALEKPKGRSRIRNHIASKASTEYILFLDVDSLPASPHFLQAYIESRTNADVIVGGTCYALKKPRQVQLLRWLYGRESEQVSAAIRQKTPREKLAFNNIMIRRSVFFEKPLLQLKHGYGHEDTLWGKSLSANTIVLHIDNPVIHTGLESNRVFLAKSKEAVENLVWLIREQNFEDASLLSRLYQKLERYGAQHLIGMLRPFTGLLQDQLCFSSTPRLFNLKLLKLFWFYRAMQRPL